MAEGSKSACLVYNVFIMEYLHGHYPLDERFFSFFSILRGTLSGYHFFFSTMQFAHVRVGLYGMVKQKCLAAIEYKKILNLVPLTIKSLFSRHVLFHNRPL